MVFYSLIPALSHPLHNKMNNVGSLELSRIGLEATNGIPRYGHGNLYFSAVMAVTFSMPVEIRMKTVSPFCYRDTIDIVLMYCR